LQTRHMHPFHIWAPSPASLAPTPRGRQHLTLLAFRLAGVGVGPTATCSATCGSPGCRPVRCVCPCAPRIRAHLVHSRVHLARSQLTTWKVCPGASATVTSSTVRVIARTLTSPQLLLLNPSSPPPPFATRHVLSVKRPRRASKRPEPPADTAGGGAV
jgi:hypothetical protein